MRQCILYGTDVFVTLDSMPFFPYSNCTPNTLYTFIHIMCFISKSETMVLTHKKLSHSGGEKAQVEGALSCYSSVRVKWIVSCSVCNNLGPLLYTVLKKELGHKGKVLDLPVSLGCDACPFVTTTPSLISSRTMDVWTDR